MGTRCHQQGCFLSSKVPCPEGVGWARAMGEGVPVSEVPCPGGWRGSLSSEIYVWRGSQARDVLGPGGLYSEVQCIMDSGHRLTDRHTHYLLATSLAGGYKAFTDTLINWCTLIFVSYIYEENYMRYE